MSNEQRISMPKSGNNLTVKEATVFFLRKCSIKNLSPETIRSYKDGIEIFSRFYGKDTLIKDMSSDTIDDYITWIRANLNCNDVSINSYLRQLRAFSYYCMDAGYLKPFKVHLIKADKELKEAYTDDELDILLKKPNVKKCNFNNEYKVWVFECYLLSTGNRLSTALNVRISDIDFESGTITLRKTKSRKMQIIPLSQSLAAILKEYLTIRGGSDDDFVFCDACGNKATNHSYQLLVRRYNIKRGVNRTGIHQFRHTFAKQWIVNGGDVVRLSKILGHSTINITMEYVNLFSTDLSMDFEKFTYIDQMRNRKKRIHV